MWPSITTVSHATSSTRSLAAATGRPAGATPDRSRTGERGAGTGGRAPGRDSARGRPRVEPGRSRRERSAGGRSARLGWPPTCRRRKVPRGTTVAGVAVGGLTEDQAAERLEDELGSRADRAARGHRRRRPHRRGVARRGRALGRLRRLGRRRPSGEESWDPVRLSGYFTGGDSLDAVVFVDDPGPTPPTSPPSTSSTAHRPVRRHDQLRGGTKIARRPNRTRTGKALDPESDTLTALARGLPWQDDPVCRGGAIELADVVPDIDADDVQEALDTFANPALASPVILVFGGLGPAVAEADSRPRSA